MSKAPLHVQMRLCYILEGAGNRPPLTIELGSTYKRKRALHRAVRHFSEEQAPLVRPGFAAHPDMLPLHYLDEQQAFAEIFRVIGVPVTHWQIVRLMKRFGSIGGLLAASPVQIMEHVAIEERHVSLLESIKNISCKLIRSEIETRLHIDWPTSLIKYIQISYAYDTREKGIALYLDPSNILIEHEYVITGTIKSLQIYPREIVVRALRVDASAVIFARTTGTWLHRVRAVDHALLDEMMTALRVMGITLLAYVVIGRGGYTFLDIPRVDEDSEP